MRHFTYAIFDGKSNCLNALRLLAAGAVLVSHGVVIVGGPAQAEPLQAVLGRSLGGLAVEVFFLISGFLVVGSAERSSGLFRYLAARAVRIYPALWASLGITALLLVGLDLLNPAPDGARLDPAPLARYLQANALMVLGGQGVVMGSFPSNPLRDVVNGSLWTLRHELRLYLLLGAICAVLGFFRARARAGAAAWTGPRGVATVLGLVWLATGGLTIRHHITGAGALDFLYFANFFSLGALVWLFRRRLSFSPWVALGGLAVLAAVAALHGHSSLGFELLYRPLLAYGVMTLAFHPGLDRRLSGLQADYSYGLYIYAFPVQQAAMRLWPSAGVSALAAVSLVLALLLAAVSWHCIERPVLRWAKGGRGASG